jgi:hypothetical protein
MIGLPAIALATLSFFALTLWHKYRSYTWLILSAVALAFSIMVKLFTIILLPIFMVGIISAEVKTSRVKEAWTALLKPVLIWFSIFCLILILSLNFFVGTENIFQFFEVHVLANTAEAFVSRAEERNINSYLQGSWTIITAAIIGTFAASWTQRWNALYLSAWMLVGYLSLRVTAPVWYHHQLLITVPAALLAGIFIGELIEFLKGRHYKMDGLSLKILFFTIGAVCIIAFFATRTIAILPQLDPKLPNIGGSIDSDSDEFPVLALMSDYSSMTDLIITDRPMFAFRLGKEISPELAVISDKRIQSGALDEEAILEIIRNMNPEQILFGRYAFDQIEAELDPEYQGVYKDGRYRLYIRRSP